MATGAGCYAGLQHQLNAAIRDTCLSPENCTKGIEEAPPNMIATYGLLSQGTPAVHFDSAGQGSVIVWLIPASASSLAQACEIN